MRVTRTLAGGSKSRKVPCLSDDEGRKEGRHVRRRTQLASSSNFHIMHYVRDVTSNKNTRRAHRISTPKLRASCDFSSTSADIYQSAVKSVRRHQACESHENRRRYECKLRNIYQSESPSARRATDGGEGLDLSRDRKRVVRVNAHCLLKVSFASSRL